MASEMEERGCGIRPCTDSSIICVLMANSFIWFAYRKGIPSEQQLSWILHYFYFLSMSQIYGMVSIGMNVYLLANTTSKPTQ